MRTPEQVHEIVEGLKAEYPLADCTLDYKKDYELLFSVRLAAQCTDERVNQITPALFARFPTLEAFAEADVRLETLTDYDHVVEQALETGYIKNEDVELLHEWRKDPANWNR